MALNEDSPKETGSAEDQNALHSRETAVEYLQNLIHEKTSDCTKIKPNDYGKVISTKDCLLNNKRLNINAILMIIDLLKDPQNLIGDIAHALNQYEEENNIKLKWKNHIFHLFGIIYLIENREDYSKLVLRLKFFYHKTIFGLGDVRL